MDLHHNPRTEFIERFDSDNFDDEWFVLRDGFFHCHHGALGTHDA